MTFLAMLANVHAPPKEADRSKYSIFKEKLCSQFEFLGKFIAAIEYRLIKYG